MTASPTGKNQYLNFQSSSSILINLTDPFNPTRVRSFHPIRLNACHHLDRFDPSSTNQLQSHGIASTAEESSRVHEIAARSIARAGETRAGQTACQGGTKTVQRQRQEKRFTEMKHVETRSIACWNVITLRAEWLLRSNRVE
jgi:hypothetical protein